MGLSTTGPECNRAKHVVRPRRNAAIDHRATTCGLTHNEFTLLWMKLHFMKRVFKAGLLQTSFSDLPTELVFLILKYSAQPIFDQTDKYEAQIRVALPELLHTVLLSKSENLTMFVDALRMQQEDAEIQK
ncbi:uncharacterized protein BJ212DRAFT_1348838 [Suillus subaureus]|uniref:Uncharacterized protein n=1 Tax=Suillus subaureus TaxID=48587 RepID=A0A9P7EDK9_9AGAM|nr:uncharacterized protein BJ212DRAFT_1348838 [Suillus subaureus]KAG1818122.1 hypothetical protein BJ212DRAFT_1348838 [Suillus subaureus]